MEIKIHEAYLNEFLEWNPEIEFDRKMNGYYIIETKEVGKDVIIHDVIDNM